VPRLVSDITEIATGLGMLGFDSLDDAIAERPPELLDVSDLSWSGLSAAWTDRLHRGEFLSAHANGAAFLRAEDGLRGRRPVRIEWRGPARAVGDEAVPADLRVDHVFLISCKYLSKILVNASPANLFDRLLALGSARRSDPDWFSAVCPAEHQALYSQVIRDHLGGLDVPMRHRDLTSVQRKSVRDVLRSGWSSECDALYRQLAIEVSARSALRWREALASGSDQRALMWRMLRIGSAPYFVLGSTADRNLRLRVGTPWDWTRSFELRSFDVIGDGTGQARVSWRAVIRDRSSRAEREILGHVEIRWSHGRFGGPPEAKVYLDSDLHQVPGYWPLV